MRLASLVVLIVTALVLGACGSKARSEPVAVEPVEQTSVRAPLEQIVELDAGGANAAGGTDQEALRASVAKSSGFDGNVQAKYADGSTELEATYEGGVKNGPWKRFSADGSVYEQGAYVGGAKNGPWVSYHPNGQKLDEGEWLNGDPVGVHRTWLEDGTLIVEKDYSKGR
ncbi:MAG: hypothetical protein PF961_18370 [Planctomycetota bacterium]|jgi:hypothetical protein|nr:hypothetical protein [Planctomycetota bacterium]